MSISVSAFRQDIYKILDHILETGIPLEINRKNGRFKIVPIKKQGKLSNLKKHKILKCPPEEIVHIDWSGEWRP